MVLGHLGINVGDLAATKSYYDVVMPLVGFEPYVVHDDEIAYRPVGAKPGTYVFFYQAEVAGGFDRRRPGLQHLAFMVRTRGEVRAVHEAVMTLGAEVLFAPRVFPEYPQPYFATFWLDPFGVMLEAVCHHDRD